jgi:putative ABC transport system permease protein
MIKNYLKIALRIIKKQKMYSFLNITGLAVSLCACFMILLHVKEELSYETSFPKADRIYRVRVDSKYGTNFRYWAASAPALGPMLEESFPEIETAVRLRSLGREIYSFLSNQTAPKRFEETQGFIADTSVIPVFDLEFISGNPETALNDPNTIVLTSKMAGKYFGNRDPVGQTLMNESQGQPLLITGLIEDLPSNTHLRIDYLISMPTFVTYMGNADLLNHRTWKAVYTYVLLSPNQRTESFYEKSPGFMKAFLSERPGRMEELKLQPIRKIHLHSKLEGEISRNSDIAYVYIFSGAAFLILLIAGVNFVNLATAQSFKRIKEIGIRKVVGAQKGQLIKQYLGDSFLLTFIAACLGLVMLNFLMGIYNQMTGKALSFLNIMTVENIVFLILLMLMLSVLAGLYPAFFVTGFQPISTLKTVRGPHSATARLRKGLVIFQFVISIFLIFSTITIYRQLVFFHNTDLGFEKDRLIALRFYGDMRQKIIQNSDALKTEILRHPGISHVSLVSSLPGDPFSNERLTPVYVQDRNTLPMLRFVRVDEDFIKTVGLKIIMGRDFNKISDQNLAYIISESAREALNLEQPLGIECKSDIHSGQAPIVGVIKDFHFASLHSPIEPLVLEYMPRWTGYMLVKVKGGVFNDVLKYLKQKYDEIAPDHLFSYLFVDDVFNENYKMEDRAYDLFKAFSIIALLVACLGLLGLTAYAAEVRVKEIGIRKVLGASIPNITILLSGEFIRWVLIANILAWPAAYFAMNKWLENFAFRIPIHFWTFLFSGALVLLFSLLTVSYQVIKAATSNPVDSLRYE